MTKMTIQDQFLNLLRKKKSPVVMFLNSGIKLQGYIASFDNFSILLKRDQHIQLVYKHSISTIAPTDIILLKDITLSAEEDTAKERENS